MSATHRGPLVASLLDAVVFDVGGTLVAENPPGTQTADLRVILLPGVAADLAALGATVRLGAATNTAVMGETDVRALLATACIDRHFDVVVTSADVGRPKPDPTVLLAVLERMGGLDPARALYVGDQPHDAVAAAAAGMPFAPIAADGLLATVERWAAGASPRPTPSATPAAPAGEESDR